MAKRSLKKGEEYEELEQEDNDHYDDHDDEDDEEGEEEEEEEEEEGEEEEAQELEYRRKKVMIRVVSAGQRLSTLSPFVNCSSSCSSDNNISSIGSLRCQADECGVELIMAKAYHKRHKVCERHAKAAVVLVSGLRQRFCQQCSKFHEIPQFDGNKKSCREKLAGHNERRRKTHTELQAADEQKPPESRMNGSLLKAMRYSDYGKMSFQGSPNMKHS